MLLKRLSPALAAVVLLLGSAPPVPASEVREKIAGFARQIAEVLKGEDGRPREVAIGEFIGPPAPKTAAGPSIQLALIEELKKLKVGVNDEAFILVSGRYIVLDDAKGNKADLTIRLLVVVENKKGEKITDLKADFDQKSNEDLIKLLAINADLSKHTNADVIGQNEVLKKQLKEQVKHLRLAGTQIKVSDSSPFAVEVLTRPAGGSKLELLKPTGTKGQAFVELKKGQEYVLRLHNNSKHEAAVSVTIDGVDAFQFFEEAGRPASFLVAPGKTRIIGGWPRSTSKVSAFLVGSYADSAAAKALKSSARIGTITLCFHPCWQGKTPPEYEGARDVAGRATGLGRDIGEKSTIIKRTRGPLLAAISIRYNK